MNKLLLFPLIFVVLFSCKNQSPKETAQSFIKALAAADLSTASTLTSSRTKAVLDKAKKETKSVRDPEEIFAFSSLSETITGNKAEVKNEIVAIPMVKEEEGWKVEITDDLLDQIQNREALLATAKAKWEALQKEYHARLQVLKDYISYKKSFGALSPNVKRLSDAVNSISQPKQWTRETLLGYVQNQQQLNTVIDNALEPSLAAHTDLSLNYFLQISNAGDKIKQAQSEYQTIAQKAHSPVYAPLPLASSKVHSN